MWLSKQRMRLFSGLGIGLSFLFVCILLGVIAELYYLLWWKKKINKSDESSGLYGGRRKLSNLFCWKQPINSIDSNSSSQELTASVLQTDADGTEPDLEVDGGGSKDLVRKGFGEEGVESEIMRLHNLCGPPRFLFTINEETKEDLESEDGRSRIGSRTRSLSDLIVAIDNPSLTPPLSSPPVKIHHPLPLDSYRNHGYNPLFESLAEADLLRLTSFPPPTFKFLRDAEEKLIRRLVEEAERMMVKNGGTIQESVGKAPPNPAAVAEDKR